MCQYHRSRSALYVWASAICWIVVIIWWYKTVLYCKARFWKLNVISYIDVLYSQCEGLLEEYDEEIIGLLRKSVTDDLVTKICVDLTRECHLHAPHLFI